MSSHSCISAREFNVRHMNRGVLNPTGYRIGFTPTANNSKGPTTYQAITRMHEYLSVSPTATYDISPRYVRERGMKGVGPNDIDNAHGHSPNLRSRWQVIAWEEERVYPLLR